MDCEEGTNVGAQVSNVFSNRKRHYRHGKVVGGSKEPIVTMKIRLNI